jgi:hypothetical protein
MLPPVSSLLARSTTDSAQYSSGEQPAYSYPTFAPIPQYTESQISTYYQQYQCYPPQPYHVIPDFYPSQQIVVPSTNRGSPSEHSYYEGNRSSSYSTSSTDPYKLAPPEDPLRRRSSHRTDRKSRSPSRTRYAIALLSRDLLV